MMSTCSITVTSSTSPQSEPTQYTSPRFSTYMPTICVKSGAEIPKPIMSKTDKAWALFFSKFWSKKISWSLLKWIINLRESSTITAINYIFWRLEFSNTSYWIEVKRGSRPKCKGTSRVRNMWRDKTPWDSIVLSYKLLLWSCGKHKVKKTSRSTHSRSITNSESTKGIWRDKSTGIPSLTKFRWSNSDQS
jgi:hypothetical protein